MTVQAPENAPNITHNIRSCLVEFQCCRVLGFSLVLFLIVVSPQSRRSIKLRMGALAMGAQTAVGASSVAFQHGLWTAGKIGWVGLGVTWDSLYGFIVGSSRHFRK